MRSPYRGFRLLVVLAALLLVPFPAADAGTLVQFTIKRFDDTLFTSVDAASRIAFDGRGHLWYSTAGGVVHVDVANHTRDLYTRVDGLPSSYSIGLDADGDTVYAGTELGLAVIETLTGKVTSYTVQNSPLPDAIVQEVKVIGDDVWLGTYFGGVAIWNTTTGEWALKNTSTTSLNAQPVRRIVPGPTAVWVTTDGDGLWKFDRSTKQWSVMLKEDGLVTNHVRAVLEGGGNLYVGTDDMGMQVRRPDGTWVVFNTTTSAIPDDHVYDIDAIPTTGGGVDIFTATRDGLWQYDGDTGNSTTLRQSFGILGDDVLENQFTRYGWAIGTTRGVSLQRGGNWSYYVTGPSSPTVSSQGPSSFMFTSASVGDAGPLLWFGTPGGIAGYRPADGEHLGTWYNRAEWSNYTGGPVNWIDTEGDVTWVASNYGVYGYRHSTQEWFERKATNSRNLVYGVEVDAGELWVPLFGDGLIMRNLTTGQTRVWDAKSIPPLPDLYLTDVRATGPDIWLGSSVGVIRMDRTTGAFPATYTNADGIPGSGIVFRLLPEGNTVWVATKDAGVAKLDVNAGRVTKVWNATNTPGFPDGEVRSLHRAGSYLWVGTTDGLARITLTSGAVKVYRTSDSDLVQNYVNGITSRDGILYLATLSGIARLDVETDQFLPMQEGPDVRQHRADAPRAPTTSSVRTSILSPGHLALVSGLVQVTGTAQATGGRVDRVEVRIADGPWKPAIGTTSWSFEWDAAEAEPDHTVAIQARAVSGGNVSRAFEVLVVPVEASETPLAIEAIVPPSAVAGRDLQFAALAQGDAPLSVTAFYRHENDSAYSLIELRQNNTLWEGKLPGRQVREGRLFFYLEAQSGRQTRTDPADVIEPYVLDVSAAPLIAVALETPSGVDVKAGETAPFTLTVTNTGNQPVTLRIEVSAEGPASRWIKTPADALTLQPGERREVSASAAVEAGAFAQERQITISAVDATGVADPVSAGFPLRVAANPAATTVAPPPGDNDSPAPAAPLLLAALATIALAHRRRRA